MGAWLLLLPQASFAIIQPPSTDSVHSWWQDKNWRPYVGGGVGISVASNIGKSQNFPNDDSHTVEYYNYTGYKPQTAALLDGVLGAEWTVLPEWLIQVGFDYNQSTRFSAKGVFTQGIDVNSADSYAYRYDVKVKQVSAQGKLLYAYSDRYYPYVLLGLGAAFNTANQYQTDVAPFSTFTRIYAGNSATSFSYNLGLGVDTVITPKLRFGLGYRFSDFGHLTLGNAVIDETPVSMTLSQSHLYINQILAQLTLMI